MQRATAPRSGGGAIKNVDHRTYTELLFRPEGWGYKEVMTIDDRMRKALAFGAEVWGHKVIMMIENRIDYSIMSSSPCPNSHGNHPGCRLFSN